MSLRLLALVVVSAVVVAALVLVAAPRAARARAAPIPGWLQSARLQLAHLPVRAAAPMTGYSREQFGPAWQDVDGNHCDTRDDILRRDLKQIVSKAGSRCVVARGTLHDPYTGKTIAFVRGVGTSTAVQIDHVVALGDAWRTGAAAWAPARRLGYANSRLVLLAVDGPANEAKGDDDASEWLPPQVTYRCRYVARQLSIKTHFRLWLTSSEHAAVAAVLAAC